LRDFLESIKTVTRYPYNLYIFDNLSDHSSENYEIIRQYSSIVTHAWACDGNYVNAPYWWAYKNLVKGKYFVMTDPDLILPANKGCWLTESIAVMDAEPRVGICSVRHKAHHPDDMPARIAWYDSWTPYHIPNVVKGKPLWHLLTVRKSIIETWETQGYNYFWCDSAIRDKMTDEGYDCVALDWDIYHYASVETKRLHPEYVSEPYIYLGKQHTISEKNLTLIV